MTSVGIDWVAIVILALAYGFAQIRSVSVRLRYGVFAAACAAIALYKLRGGAAGSNMFFVLLAGGFAVWYAVKALRAGESR